MMRKGTFARRIRPESSRFTSYVSTEKRNASKTRFFDSAFPEIILFLAKSGALSLSTRQKPGFFSGGVLRFTDVSGKAGQIVNQFSLQNELCHIKLTVNCC
jgi:hypothetical protein